VRNAIIVAIGALALLTGCSNQSDKATGIPVGPKWKGLPYRLSVDAKAPAPNKAGITIPTIKYSANPDALETRATMVVRFDSSGAKTDKPITDQMIIGPFDISGTDGVLPADYMDTADQGLARLLGAYCMKGNVKLSVSIARSSLSPQAADAELDAKRLSDWLPITTLFKNPHPKC
jgi:hypothetical protein